MSAFIVSEKHVKTIAHYYNQLIDQNSSIDNITKILWSENVKSVNYRYNEKSRRPKLNNNVKPLTNINNIQLLKLIHCLQYQSCETPNWNKSKSSKLLQKILDLSVFQSIASLGRSSEYIDAKWHI